MRHARECAKLTSITKFKGAKSETRQRHPSVMHWETGAGSQPLPLEIAAASTSSGEGALPLLLAAVTRSLYLICARNP